MSLARAPSGPDLSRMLPLWLAPAGSCPDGSTVSDESLTSDDVLCVFEYAEDIHQHMRESEVRNHRAERAPVRLTEPLRCLTTGRLQATARLLGEPPRDHRRHAGHPRQLDGGSCSGVQAALRNAAPLRQLRGPLPVPDQEREAGQAAAGRHLGADDRRVSAAGLTPLSVNVPTGAAPVGSTRRSTPRTWTSSCTPPTAPTAGSS